MGGSIRLSGDTRSLDYSSYDQIGGSCISRRGLGMFIMSCDLMPAFVAIAAACR